MAALTSLTFGMRPFPSWTAQMIVTGLTNNSVNKNDKSRTYSLGTTVAAAAVAGADSLYVAIATLAASGTVNIDLSSFTDVMGRLTQAMVRLKAYHFRLYDATDDSTIVTPASSITIGNVANGHALNLTSNVMSFNLLPGEYQEWITPSAAGLTVDGTHHLIKILNNDGANQAKFLAILCGGSV